MFVEGILGVFDQILDMMGNLSRLNPELKLCGIVGRNQVFGTPSG